MKCREMNPGNLSAELGIDVGLAASMKCREMNPGNWCRHAIRLGAYTASMKCREMNPGNDCDYGSAVCRAASLNEVPGNESRQY